MTTVESEWDDQQRGLMLALAEYEAQTCRCGGYLPETTDPANEGRFRPSPPRRCHKCTAISQAAGPYQENPHPHALMYPIEFVEG